MRCIPVIERNIARRMKAPAPEAGAAQPQGSGLQRDQDCKMK